MADNERLLVSCPSPPKTIKIKVNGSDTTVPTPPELVNWFEQVRTMLDVAYGTRREAEAMRFVTFQELVNSGLVTGALSSGKRLRRNPATLTGALMVDLPNITVDDRLPDVPASVSATATFKAIILSWTLPSYGFHSYTEVWRNNVNNLATAVHHKDTSGATWSDDIGTGVTHYYWIRHVGTNGKRSAFSNGVTATTGKLTGSTEIVSLSVTNALIANLAVDNAKIADVSAGKLSAGTITAGSIFLGSTAFTLDGTTKRMTITGGGSQAVELGSLSYDTTKYGLHIKNSAGTTVMKADQSVVELNGSILVNGTAAESALAPNIARFLRCRVAMAASVSVEDASTSTDLLSVTAIGSVPSGAGYSIDVANSRIYNQSSTQALKILMSMKCDVQNTSSTANKYGTVQLVGALDGGAFFSAHSLDYANFRLAANSTAQWMSYSSLPMAVFSVPVGSYIRFFLQTTNSTAASDGLVSVYGMAVGWAWHE